MISVNIARLVGAQLQIASKHLTRRNRVFSCFSDVVAIHLLKANPSALVQQRCLSTIPAVKAQILTRDCQLELVSKRCYSKGKERGKEKKKGPVVINEAEIAELVKVDRLKSELQKGIDDMKADFVKNLTIRSPFSAIENLEVQLDSETYTLQEIAQIGKKGSNLIVLNLASTPQAIKPVLKAINDAGLGLNPQQDGTTVFINIPKVTREYRESLAKSAKAYFQKFKDHSRDVQNRYIREVRKKEKEVSQDLAFSVQQQIHALEEHYVKEAEKIMIAKQNELLGNKE